MFDFSSYLASQLSPKPVDFRVEILTGGLTNVTARAIFVVATSVFGSHSVPSIVLKYAPPFVASDPAQPMSVHRQVIEGNALLYLTDSSEIKALLSDFPYLKIPELVHHDTKANVLWITDLGESLTLSKFLCSQPPPASATVHNIASTLGTFIAKFWIITSYPAPGTIELFARRRDDQGNPAAFLAETARSVMALCGVLDAEVLAERVAEAMQAEKRLEPCLGMVDLWPGSIIINPDGTRGLVDWEYFGLSTPGAEVGMFVAHLHLILLDNNTPADVSAVVRSFVAIFLDNYGTHAPTISPYFKRQALIAYGREMVTAIEFFAAELDEPSRKRVLDKGIWSLRSAGESQDNMESKILDSRLLTLWDDTS
ncbi:kinase-like domain-containing protein [Mycena sp. CBHHK59/15]|nr:kinase-like domain-containing protein [Mycena sp. CBHHK59/15]